MTDSIPTESRIPMLSIEDARATAKEAGVNSAMAGLNVFRVLLHQPKVARAASDMLNTLLWKGTLDKRLRELIIMRLGWETGSVYEWTQHWRVATSLGVSEKELLAVRDWQNARSMLKAERALLSKWLWQLVTGDSFHQCYEV